MSTPFTPRSSNSMSYLISIVAWQRSNGEEGSNCDQAPIGKQQDALDPRTSLVVINQYGIGSYQVTFPSVSRKLSSTTAAKRLTTSKPLNTSVTSLTPNPHPRRTDNGMTNRAVCRHLTIVKVITIFIVSSRAYVVVVNSQFGIGSRMRPMKVLDRLPCVLKELMLPTAKSTQTASNAEKPTKVAMATGKASAGISSSSSS